MNDTTLHILPYGTKHNSDDPVSIGRDLCPGVQSLAYTGRPQWCEKKE